MSLIRLQIPSSKKVPRIIRFARGERFLLLASENSSERITEGRKFRGNVFHAGDPRVDFPQRCNRIASAINYCCGKKRGWNLGREGACLLATVGNKSVRIREEISTSVVCRSAFGGCALIVERARSPARARFSRREAGGKERGPEVGEQARLFEQAVFNVASCETLTFDPLLLIEFTCRQRAVRRGRAISFLEEGRTIVSPLSASFIRRLDPRWSQLDSGNRNRVKLWGEQGNSAERYGVL